MSQAEEHEALVEACAEAVGGEWPTARARAVLAVIAEKAKEWPTEGMTEQFLKYYTLTADDSCAYQAKDVFRAMFAASPFVKPEPARSEARGD